MQPDTSILILRPAQDDPAAASISEWMEQLESNLERVLRKTLPDAPALRVYVPGAASGMPEGRMILLVLLGAFSGEGTYLKSLQSFLEKQKERIIRVVRIDCLEDKTEGLPEILANAVSINFLLHQGETAPGLLLDEHEPAYWSKLVDLGMELEPLLASDPKVRVSGQSPAIYLAQTTPDMSANRDLLRRELAENAFRILPEVDLGSRLKSLRSDLFQWAGESILAIHLLGDSYGPVRRETGKSLAESQVDYISEYLERQEEESREADRKMSRLIWLDPDFNPVDSKQEEFIGRLKRNIEHLHATEIIQNPLELFKTLVIKRLKDILSDQMHEGPGREAEHFIYLIHSESGESDAATLSGKMEKEVMPVRMLNFAAKDAPLLEMHQTLLQQCEHAVILYSDENRFWLRSKIMDLLKAPGMGRAQGMRSKQILASGKDLLQDYAVPSGIRLFASSDPLSQLPELIKNMKQ